MAQTLNREMMVLVNRDNHLAAVSLPAGKAFVVLGAAHEKRFVRIRVDDEEFTAFESDLADRCKGFKLESGR